ncbi:MinD/ParA family protein [Thermosediminibacter oceani]|uniref:Cobyrinic acid ac-diamide synthase n=1 Tax=Thermosediminibacter oceani (strain ATCC BAA-1034 / DSM 16646 / JW/IW-1228P) TaxID=555079 RepID=D9S3A3_THEOJ|nr:MinD/ParA family protein [Thermosediminibacter oceani]ADL07880.1 cobyrinic acid ac-diamide synthase [Thermosediminibacter oceani DSM 16646]
MNDQASKLRSLEKRRVHQVKVSNSVRVIAVTSGKGGVGKTNFSVNVSIALQEMGKSVLLIDADLGLANVDLLMGLNPKFNLFHVLAGQKSINDIILDGPGGIKIIPGASGLYNLANLSQTEIDGLIKAFNNIDLPLDIIVIDTGAGISKNVMSLVRASKEVVVVTTPEPTSLTDAYAVIKLVHKDVEKIHLVVNKADNFKTAEATAQRLTNASLKFLSTSINYLGFILEDKTVFRSNMEQVPFYVRFPSSLPSKCVMNIGRRLLEGELDFPVREQTVGGWIKKFLSFMRK